MWGEEKILNSPMVECVVVANNVKSCIGVSWGLVLWGVNIMGSEYYKGVREYV